MALSYLQYFEPLWCTEVLVMKDLGDGHLSDIKFRLGLGLRLFFKNNYCIIIMCSYSFFLQKLLTVLKTI